MDLNQNRNTVIQFAFRPEEAPLVPPFFINDDWFVRNYYKIKVQNYSSNNYFGVSSATYLIKFDLESLPLDSVLSQLKKCLLEIITIVKHNDSLPLHSNHVRMVITAPSLRENINLPFRFLDDVAIEIILNEIERVCQSNQGLFLDDLLTFYFITKQ
jgi:hypothetical protein